MLTKYTDVMKPSYYDYFDPFKVLDALYTSDRGVSSRVNFYRVENTDEALTLSIDLPGLKSKDLTVETAGREIKVSGTIRNEEFKYTYKVPKQYEPETAKACLEDGVLTLEFKKTNESSSKKIEVVAK